MNKPYVFAHMLTSIDGRVMGNYMKLPEESACAPGYREITHGNPYASQGSICGRGTAEDDFTFGKAPDLDPNAAPVPEGDFIAVPDAEDYHLVIDRNGVLGWETSHIDYGSVESHIVEVLSEKASNEYKDFLRRMGISYLICGKETVDFAVMLDKAYELLNLRRLTVSGPALTWSMVRGGFVDEVSVYIVPLADGSTEHQSYFMTVPGMSEDVPVVFDLVGVEQREGGAVWLRYKVKKIWEHDEFAEKIGFGRKEFVKESQNQ